MTEDLKLLSEEEAQKIKSQGYEFGEPYKTHSSTFYPLTKEEKEFLLKLDQTDSGSIKHQVLLSQLQRDLGLPGIAIDRYDSDYRYLIMEKVVAAESFRKNLTVDRVREWGRQLSLIHSQYEVEYQTWHQDKKEFCDSSLIDTLEFYIDLARSRFDKLSKEDVLEIEEKIGFLQNSYSNIQAKPSFVLGDTHTANVMLVDNKPMIIDPNGTVLYGPKYIDLAIVAVEFTGYFESKWTKHEHDKEYFEAFLEGYGQVDIELLRWFIVLRGIGRYFADEMIGHVKDVTRFCYESAL
jgi:fructosamine-3-kinase